MRKLFSPLVVTALATVGSMVFTPSAFADWQYTQWEMTTAEVKTASHGAAQDNNNRELDAEDLKAQLVAHYNGEAISFTAVFLFDNESKLKDVTLNPTSTADCPKIESRLRSHYGDPAESTDLIHAGVIRWDDFDDKNQIVFLKTDKDGCTIQYSKLHNTRPNGDGL
jgi:hypothetical protein